MITQLVSSQAAYRTALAILGLVNTLPDEFKMYNLNDLGKYIRVVEGGRYIRKICLKFSA